MPLVQNAHQYTFRTSCIKRTDSSCTLKSRYRIITVNCLHCYEVCEIYDKNIGTFEKQHNIFSEYHNKDNAQD